ncbi:uncharacterized protein [Procambarus clarkii]|uniref:uncharacterized protein n=1 Tax=Procambarus clarkii TaxID=6728 RepID=UPI0037449E46
MGGFQSSVLLKTLVSGVKVPVQPPPTIMAILIETSHTKMDDDMDEEVYNHYQYNVRGDPTGNHLPTFENTVINSVTGSTGYARSSESGVISEPTPTYQQQQQQQQQKQQNNSHGGKRKTPAEEQELARKRSKEHRDKENAKVLKENDTLINLKETLEDQERMIDMTVARLNNGKVHDEDIVQNLNAFGLENRIQLPSNEPDKAETSGGGQTTAGDPSSDQPPSSSNSTMVTKSKQEIDRERAKKHREKKKQEKAQRLKDISVLKHEIFVAKLKDAFLRGYELCREHMQVLNQMNDLGINTQPHLGLNGMGNGTCNSKGGTIVFFWYDESAVNEQCGSENPINHIGSQQHNPGTMIPSGQNLASHSGLQQHNPETMIPSGQNLASHSGLQQYNPGTMIPSGQNLASHSGLQQYNPGTMIPSGQNLASHSGLQQYNPGTMILSGQNLASHSGLQQYNPGTMIPSGQNLASHSGLQQYNPGTMIPSGQNLASHSGLQQYNPGTMILSGQNLASHSGLQQYNPGTMIPSGQNLASHSGLQQHNPGTMIPFSPDHMTNDTMECFSNKQLTTDDEFNNAKLLDLGFGAAVLGDTSSKDNSDSD